MTGHGLSVPPGMNAINLFRRISPLAVMFVALAAVLALTPSAHAQSTATVKLQASGLDPSLSLVAAATPGGETTVELNSEPSYFQRWARQSTSTGTYRFSRLGFNVCLRVPDGLSAATHGAVVLGNCSGTRAQWRRINGNYINAATGHYMSPPLCLINPCDHRLQAFPAEDVPFVGASLMRWSLRFL
jgi:hypothetical protein